MDNEMTLEIAIATMLSAIDKALDFKVPAIESVYKSVFNLHDIRLIVESKAMITKQQSSPRVPTLEVALTSLYLAIIHAGQFPIYAADEAITILEALDFLVPYLPQETPDEEPMPTA